jgi:hypothetical protein
MSLLTKIKTISRTTLIVIAGIVVLLVVFRLLLPGIVTHYVNKTINSLPGYAGHVGDIDIHLYHGAYTINDIDIYKVNGNRQLPFFSARKIDLSVEWKALLDGSIVGRIIFNHPRMNFIEGPTKATSQTSVDKSWQDKVKELFPLRINRFEIIDGEVHYMAPHKKPKVDVYMQNLDAVAENLTNSKDISKSLVANIRATGTVMKSGSFQFNVQLDPFAKQPTFHLTSKLKKVPLVQLNDFLQAYGDFDVEGGTFELTAEFAADHGRFKGYAKPFFKNMKVFTWEKEKHKNVFQIAWEAIVATVTDIFENKETKAVATRVDFSGSFNDPQADVWSTVGGILKNAFIRALVPNIENSVQVKSIGDKGKK